MGKDIFLHPKCRADSFLTDSRSLSSAPSHEIQMMIGLLDIGQLWAIPGKVRGRTLAITFKIQGLPPVSMMIKTAMVLPPQQISNISSGSLLLAIFSVLVFAFFSAIGGPGWNHATCQKVAGAYLQQGLQRLFQQMELLPHVLQFTHSCGKWQSGICFFMRFPHKQRCLVSPFLTMTNPGKCRAPKPGRLWFTEESVGEL